MTKDTLDKNVDAILSKNPSREIDFFQLEGMLMPASPGRWKISVFVIDENDARGRHQFVIGEGDFLSTQSSEIKSWFKHCTDKYPAKSASVDILIDPF